MIDDAEREGGFSRPKLQKFRHTIIKQFAVGFLHKQNLAMESIKEQKQLRQYPQETTFVGMYPKDQW